MGAHLPRGARIAGYEVLGLLGEGGMGAVYQVRDAAGRSVALKLMSGALAPGDQERRRFEREALAAAAVVHPNVTRVHGAGEDQGRPFIVFELVPGGSLGRIVRERGALPWPEAVRHAIGVARGLGAIHAAGFVHRDLKPDNVLLAEDGTPKVSDLGLVRSLAGTRSQALTKTGEILGTPAYMAPEQVDGAGTVDARADVYALGATLFALVEGEAPFKGAGAALLFAVLKSPPPSLRRRGLDVPPALDALVLECLAKDPGRRPASAAEVATRLEAIARGEGGKGSGLRAGRLAAGAFVALALVAGVAWAALGRGPTPGPQPSPSPSASPGPDPAALLERAQVALDDHRAPEAERIAASVLAREPANAAAHLVRATALEELWRVREARADLEAAGPSAGVPGLALEAALLADERRYDEALERAKRALDAAPENALALAVQGEAGFWRDQVRNIPAARLAATTGGARARKAKPTLARAWLVGALPGLLGGERVDLAAARAVAEALPSSPWAWFLLARALDDGLSTPESRFALQLALDRDGGISELWAGRAHARADSGDVEGALADATRATELPPVDSTAWNTLAFAKLARGDPRGAVEAAERRIHEFEDDWFSHWIVGLALKREGHDTDGAMGHLARAAKLREFKWASPVADLLELCLEQSLDAGLYVDQCGPDELWGPSEHVARAREAYRKIKSAGGR